MKANSRSIDAKIPLNLAKIHVGVAIKSGRGNVKGSDIMSPPPCTYSLSNSTRKEAVSKKNSILMSDPPKIRKFIFHIRKKSVFLASHGFV